MAASNADANYDPAAAAERDNDSGGGLGCFAKSCLGCLVVLIGLIILLTAGVYYFSDDIGRWAVTAGKQYMLQMLPPEMSSEDRRNFMTTTDRFLDEVGKSVSQEEFQMVIDKARVYVQDDQRLSMEEVKMLQQEMQEALGVEAPPLPPTAPDESVSGAPNSGDPTDSGDGQGNEFETKPYAPPQDGGT